MGQEVISNKSENPDESLVWIFLASCNEWMVHLGDLCNSVHSLQRDWWVKYEVKKCTRGSNDPQFCTLYNVQRLTRGKCDVFKKCPSVLIKHWWAGLRISNWRNSKRISHIYVCCSFYNFFIWTVFPIEDEDDSNLAEINAFSFEGRPNVMMRQFLLTHFKPEHINSTPWLKGWIMNCLTLALAKFHQLQNTQLSLWGNLTQWQHCCLTILESYTVPISMSL